MAAKDTTTPAPAEPTADAPVSTIEPRFDNPEAMQFNDAPVIESERGNLANGDSRERTITPIRDTLYVSPERRKAWGAEDALLTSELDTANQMGIQLQGTKVLVALRDHKQYPMESDRYWDAKERYESLAPVTAEGRQQGHRDLLYYTVDRAEYERHQRLRDQSAIDFKKGLDKKELRTQEGGTVKGFDEKDAATMDREYDRAHGLLNDPGFATPYPQGMSYEDILRYNGVEKTRAIEVQAASGGRSSDVGAFNQFMEERAKEAKSKAKNRKYSFSGSPTR